MAITYPVDVQNTWWHYYNTDTGELGPRRRWLHKYGREVSLDPNIIPLLVVEGAKPAVDELTHKIVVDSAVVDLAANTYTLTYASQRKTDEEVEQAIVSREQNEAERHLRLREELFEMRASITLLLEAVDYTGLGPAKRNFLDNQVAKGTKILQNRQRARQLKQNVSTVTQAEIESGWSA